VKQFVVSVKHKFKINIFVFDRNQKLFYFIVVRKHNGMLFVKIKKRNTAVKY